MKAVSETSFDGWRMEGSTTRPSLLNNCLAEVVRDSPGPASSRTPSKLPTKPGDGGRRAGYDARLGAVYGSKRKVIAQEGERLGFRQRHGEHGPFGKPLHQ